LLLLRDGRLQLLHLAMFFQKLVEQHRVNRFIAHCHDFSILIASDEIRINLLYLLSYETELRDAIWINILFVAERDRL
jgi:hypothetical protein